jgi:hypothetical protein
MQHCYGSRLQNHLRDRYTLQCIFIRINDAASAGSSAIGNTDSYAAHKVD